MQRFGCFGSVLTVLTVTALCLSLLCGCGKAVVIPSDAHLMNSGDKSDVVLPAEKLDPAAVYKTLTYTPEMFCGEYTLPDGKEGLDAYCNASGWMEYSAENITRITAIPYAICALPEENFTVTDENGEQQTVYMMSLSFRSDAGTQVTKEAACTVKDREVSFRIVAGTTYDETTGKERYEFTDAVLTYGFSFSGIKLILNSTRDDHSVTLVASPFAATRRELIGDAYLASGDGIAGIYRINYGWSDNGISDFACYDRGNNALGRSYGILYEDGTFQLGLEVDGTLKTGQYVYFLTMSGGLILTDGEKTFGYTDDMTTAYRKRLEGNIEGDTEPTEELLKKRDDLVKDLTDSCKQNGIDVTVDAETGDLSIGAGFLFAGDSAAISDGGKAMLAKVITTYAETISKEEYRGYVGKIIVEGHTAPLPGSTIESGYELSKQRADTVAAFLLSEETGLDADKRQFLTGLVEAVGKSCADPVKDENGQVDLNASRRVTFRFLIHEEKT